MKLPSGRVVPNAFLSEVAEAIVEVHASYGFDDWGEALSSTGGSLAEDNWGDEKPFESEKDRDAILDMVTPVARQVSDVLSVVHSVVLSSLVENRDWGGIQGILKDLLLDVHKDRVDAVLRSHGTTQDELDLFLKA